MEQEPGGPGTPYEDAVAGGLCRPPAGATGFSAIRILPDRQRFITYCEVDALRGWPGVEHFVRTLYKVGFIRRGRADEPSYGVLDVIDDDGDIIAEYAIPHAQAWRYIYRKLGLRITHDPRKATE